MSPYPEEEYYLGKSSWSGNASDWDQRFEVGDVVADPSGSWEPSTAEAYIDSQVAQLNTSIASETIARQNADANLQTNINSEMGTRSSQDANLLALINAGLREGGTYQFDSVPTVNSSNLMTSGAIYSTIKDSNLGFIDNIPTERSNNLVKSGGVYSSIYGIPQNISPGYETGHYIKGSTGAYVSLNIGRISSPITLKPKETIWFRAGGSEGVGMIAKVLGSPSDHSYAILVRGSGSDQGTWVQTVHYTNPNFYNIDVVLSWLSDTVEEISIVDYAESLAGRLENLDEDKTNKSQSLLWINTLEELQALEHGFYNISGVEVNHQYLYKSGYIRVPTGKEVKIIGSNLEQLSYCCIYTIDKVLKRSFNESTVVYDSDGNYTVTLSEDEAYIAVAFDNQAQRCGIIFTNNSVASSQTITEKSLINELYIKSQIIEGEQITFESTNGYIDKNGNFVSYSSYSVSDPILLKSGKRIIFYGRGYYPNVSVISRKSSENSYFPLVLSVNDNSYKSSYYTYTNDSDEDIYIVLSYDNSDIKTHEAFITGIPSSDGVYQGNINLLTAYDNLVCIGDSLTWSAVYTAPSSNRQAYVTYPKALSRLCGNQYTMLARGGATAKSCWDEFGSQIVAKDNALAIVYLGTNAGISDTLDTDVVGNDPNNWTDNNTGCYCRIVQKLRVLGYKVLLIKCWTSSGTGGSSLVNTNNAIKNIGNRFGCAILENPFTNDSKYHLYPDGTGTNGAHYNDLGYARFASKIIEYVGKLDVGQLNRIIPD